MEEEAVKSTECIACLHCVTVCPAQNCLTTRMGNEAVRWWMIGAGAIAMFLLIWIIALSFGMWHSTFPAEIYRMLYQKMM